MADESETTSPDQDADTQPAPTTLDPVSRWLLGVAFALVVVLLVTGASVVMYVLGLRSAPRSNTEYVVSTNQAAVAANPGDAGAWAKLAYAYAAEKRFQVALSTARQGRSASGDDSLLLVEADVLRESGDNTAARNAYDRALTAMQASVAATKQKLQAEQIYVPLGGDSTLAPIYYGRALSEHALGDLTSALSDLHQATTLAPDEANLWVTLGDYEAEAGETAQAKAAYRSALKLVPGMPEARSGLDKLAREGK